MPTLDLVALNAMQGFDLDATSLGLLCIQSRSPHVDDLVAMGGALASKYLSPPNSGCSSAKASADARPTSIHG